MPCLPDNKQLGLTIEGAEDQEHLLMLHGYNMQSMLRDNLLLEQLVDAHQCANQPGYELFGQSPCNLPMSSTAFHWDQTAAG